MQTIKKFIQYYAPYKAVFFIDLLCAAFISLVDLAFPQIQADIVVCHHFAEGFGDMPHRYSIFCGFLQGSPPFFCLTENKAVLSYKERLCSVCMGFTRQRCSLLQCTARTERTALPARGSTHLPAPRTLRPPGSHP